MCETGADSGIEAPLPGAPTPVIFNKFYKMDFQWTIASQPLGGTHANELIRMREARAGPCNFTTFKHPL